MGVLPATSRSARFQPYFSVLDDAGVDVERALSQGKFASQILYQPDIVVPSQPVIKFVARIARQNGIDDIVFRGATRESFDSLEPWVKSHLLGAATLGEMLQHYCSIARQYNTYHTYDVQCDERLARVCCALPVGTKVQSWHAFSDWSNVSLFLESIRYVLGQGYEPTAITLQAKSPLTSAMQQAIGTTRLLQGWKCSSVVFPKHLLATPLPDVFPSTRAHGSAQQDVIEDVSFPAVMRQLIKPCLSENWLDVQTAADMSGCSVRTFQRRLSDAGLTYKKLLEQTRMEVARSRLADQQDSILDIGYDIGYTDPSNFTRAFRRAHGVTPAQFRHANLQL